MGVVSVDGAVRSLDHEIEHEGLRFGEDGYDVRVFRLKGKMEASEVDRGEHGWSRFWRRRQESQPGNESRDVRRS